VEVNENDHESDCENENDGDDHDSHDGGEDDGQGDGDDDGDGEDESDEGPQHWGGRGGRGPGGRAPGGGDGKGSRSGRLAAVVILQSDFNDMWANLHSGATVDLNSEDGDDWDSDFGRAGGGSVHLGWSVWLGIAIMVAVLLCLVKRACMLRRQRRLESAQRAGPLVPFMQFRASPAYSPADMVATPYGPAMYAPMMPQPQPQLQAVQVQMPRQMAYAPQLA